MSEETTIQSNELSSLEDLAPKMKLEGTVTNTELYGAFVDIGLERDGMVHISRLASRRVNKVSDKVKPGDKVTVWVVDVEPETSRIALTMVEPPEIEWKDLKAGQIHTGEVVRLERYGAFVDIGAERPGLLHVREMSKGYVKHRQGWRRRRSAHYESRPPQTPDRSHHEHGRSTGGDPG